jgi:ABC-type microcin C transport system permease subunit YejE
MLHKSKYEFFEFYATNRIATIKTVGFLVARGEIHLSPLGELIGFNKSNNNLGVIIKYSFV